MKNPIVVTLLSSVWLTLAPISYAATVEGLLESYRSQGAQEFSIQRGEQLWMTEYGGRSCGNCHTEHPKAQGKHQKTGKPIKPLAPSINSERLSNAKTIKKWLKRNCKWTLGRECSAQEKGDFLTWLQTQ
ncbi:MAG: DUF1924 domain-containing protein [Motiliproteus sp.]|nr:DUF1924 domain-containing protein [Motiliproteus sp.]MCW9052619.1 DUF1924 domain-containing protein [Motiliproteus sp.]